MRNTILIFILFSFTACYKFGPNPEARSKLNAFTNKLEVYTDHFVSYRRQMFQIRYDDIVKRVYYLDWHFNEFKAIAVAIDDPAIAEKLEHLSAGIAFLNYWTLYTDPYYEGDYVFFKNKKPHLKPAFQEAFDKILKNYLTVMSNNTSKMLGFKTIDFEFFILDPNSNSGKTLLDINKVAYQLLAKDAEEMDDLLKNH